MADLSTSETWTKVEEQKKQKLVQELQDRLAETEIKIAEGENLRKKLHNTILVIIACLFNVVGVHDVFLFIKLLAFVGFKRKYSSIL